MAISLTMALGCIGNVLLMSWANAWTTYIHTGDSCACSPVLNGLVRMSYNCIGGSVDNTTISHMANVLIAVVNGIRCSEAHDVVLGDTGPTDSRSS